MRRLCALKKHTKIQDYLIMLKTKQLKASNSWIVNCLYTNIKQQQLVDQRSTPPDGSSIKSLKLPQNLDLKLAKINQNTSHNYVVIRQLLNGLTHFRYKFINKENDSKFMYLISCHFFHTKSLFTISIDSEQQ
jgi:hypothetical protein